MRKTFSHQAAFSHTTKKNQELFPNSRGDTSAWTIVDQFLTSVFKLNCEFPAIILMCYLRAKKLPMNNFPNFNNINFSTTSLALELFSSQTLHLKTLCTVKNRHLLVNFSIKHSSSDLTLWLYIFEGPPN